MKESISMLKEFISIQRKIEEEYNSIRIDGMQKHFYIRICVDPNNVVHKSPDASFKQMVSYLYKQLIDCKPDNTKFVNGYAHLIGEPSGFEKEFFDAVHAFRTLEQHEPSDADCKKYEGICKRWTLGALSKELPSNDRDWRVCEHYLLQNGIQYLQKKLYILAKFPNGGETLQEEWFRYQKQDITIYQAKNVLEKIKSDFEYEFDTEKYYRQQRGKLKESLKFIDWRSNDVERQIYECFCQVIFLMPPKRKMLIQPNEIKEKYGVKDKRQLAQIMKEVSEFCLENPKRSQEEVWKFLDNRLKIQL